MKRFSVILLLCVTVVSVMAQKTLSGTILSRTDGRPVEMATVRLFMFPKLNMPAPPADMPDSIMVQGAQTYDDGLFILSNVRPGKYKLVISSVG